MGHLALIEMSRLNERNRGRPPGPGADLLRRITGVDAPVMKVARRDTAYREHASFADGHARCNDGSRRDPSSVTYADRRGTKVEARGFPVVVSCAQISRLRNAAMRADGDVGKVVDPGILSDPGVIADCQPPREFDAHAGLDRHAVADTRAEQAQQNTTMSRTWKLRANKQTLHYEPERLNPYGLCSRKGGIIEQIKPHVIHFRQ